mgnify:CR=1 FL=1
MQVEVTRDVFRLAEVFTISRGSRTEAQVLTVRITDGGATGRGECVPYARYDETLDSVTAEIEGLPDRFDRAALYDLLPAGAARNAVDCALWDLEAKLGGERVVVGQQMRRLDRGRGDTGVKGVRQAGIGIVEGDVQGHARDIGARSRLRQRSCRSCQSARVVANPTNRGKTMQREST